MRRTAVGLALCSLLAGAAVTLHPAAATTSDSAPPSCTSTATCTHVQEWQMPIPIAAPKALASGPDGAMWSWALGSDQVLRFDPRDGALLSAWTVPGAFHANYAGLAAGPDGNMWLTAARPTPNANTTAANAVIRITPTGQQTEVGLSPNGAKPVGPRGIVAGPPSDPDAMWFAESANGFLIGRVGIDDHSVASYALPGYTGSGFAITRGPDAAGNPDAAIWLATFSDSSGTDHVLRLEVSPTGAPKVTLAVALPLEWHPTGLTGGPVDPSTGKQDGVWLTDDSLDRLGHITPDGTMSSWPVTLNDPDPPTNGSQGCQDPNPVTTCGPGSLRVPTAITTGPDGGIWVAVKAINSIARFDPRTQTFDRVYRGLKAIDRPVGIAVGPDGNIWYASVDASLVGRVLLDPPAAASTVPSAFTLSGPFAYDVHNLVNFPLRVPGQPLGIASAGQSLEVAMVQADRLQRVPPALTDGPPPADQEQLEQPLDPGNPQGYELPVRVSATTDTRPWRTIEVQKAGPRILLGSSPRTGGSEWVTMYDDTVEKLTPGDGTTGDSWSEYVTVTSLAACCLTINGVIGLSGPGQVAVTPNGNAWFTEFASGNIALANTEVGTEESLPTPDSGPFGLVATDDGSLWFTEVKADQIGHRLPGGGYVEYPLGAGADPYGITAGPDGAIWFTMRGRNAVGRIDSAGHITSYPMPTADAQPTAIATGPDGALYVTEYLTGSVARLEPRSDGGAAWTEWRLPYGDLSHPYWVTVGPDKQVWVTLPYQDRIARLDPTTATPTVISSPTAGDTVGEHVLVRGTSAGRATVIVTADGVQVGTTSANPNGSWSLDCVLPAGTHTLVAAGTDPSGATRTTSAPVSVTVPQR